MVQDYTFKYVSPSGREIELSRGGIDANGETLPWWTMEPVTLNGRIAGMRSKLSEFTIPLIIVAETPQEGISKRNELFEVPALDIERNTPGRLYFNEWYIEGFITASEVTNFWQLKRAAQYSLTFSATSPKWVRETRRSYTEQYSPIGIFLDYPHDFAYDYGVSKQVFTIENENFTDTPILIRIFGSVDNPRITINNNVYRVNVSLDEGDYIEIDGFNYTVEIVKSNGDRVNAFPYIVGDFAKDSGSYIFQPVPPGISEVLWSGEFDFDIVSFEQRGEPKWN